MPASRDSANVHGPRHRSQREARRSDEDESRGHQQCDRGRGCGEHQPGKDRSGEIEDFFDDGIEAQCSAEKLRVGSELGPGNAHRRSERRRESAQCDAERDERRRVWFDARKESDRRERAAKTCAQVRQCAAGTVSIDEPRATRGERSCTRAVASDHGSRECVRTGGLDHGVQERQQHDRERASADDGDGKGDGGGWYCEHVDVTRSLMGRHGHSSIGLARVARVEMCERWRATVDVADIDQTREENMAVVYGALERSAAPLKRRCARLEPRFGTSTSSVSPRGEGDRVTA